MSIRPALGFGAFALAAVVGAAFALNAMIGTPTANASGPDREIGDGWTYEPPAQNGADGATIQCWIVIKNSNVEGSNICSPGAKATSIENKTVVVKKAPSGEYGSEPDNEHDYEEPSTSDTTVCQAEGLIVQQQCDVDGDAEQTIVVAGLPLLGTNGVAKYEEGYVYKEGDGASSEDTTVCVAEGDIVQQQCDVDGDAEQTIVVVSLLRETLPVV